MSTADIRWAPAPFNDTLADAILCSSDGVGFKVFKADLIRSSPFFRDMFSLPQPVSSIDPNSYIDGLPVVVLSESGVVLDALLRCCTFGVTPNLKTLEDAAAILGPAEKYQLASAEATAVATLMRVTEAEPIRAYFLA